MATTVRNYALDEKSAFEEMLDVYFSSNGGRVSSNEIRYEAGSKTLLFVGSNFSHEGSRLTSGTVKGIKIYDGKSLIAELSDFVVDAKKWVGALNEYFWDRTDYQAIVEGKAYDYYGAKFDDEFTGGRLSDHLRGAAGNDVLDGWQRQAGRRRRLR